MSHSTPCTWILCSYMAETRKHTNFSPFSSVQDGTSAPREVRVCFTLSHGEQAKKNARNAPTLWCLGAAPLPTRWSGFKEMTRCRYSNVLQFFLAATKDSAPLKLHLKTIVTYPGANAHDYQMERGRAFYLLKTILTNVTSGHYHWTV